MSCSSLRLVSCVSLSAALVGCLAPTVEEGQTDLSMADEQTEPDEPDQPELELDGAPEFKVAWIGVTELVYEGNIYFMATSEPARCSDIGQAFEGDVEDLGEVFILALKRSDIDEDLIGHYSARYDKDCEAVVYGNHAQGLLQNWNATTGVCSIALVTEDRVDGDFELEGNQTEDPNQKTYRLEGSFSAERCGPVDW